MKGPTYLGTVHDVQGATVTATLDESTLSGVAFIDGVSYRIGQVGSFVRIPIGFMDLFGVVTEVGAGTVPEARVESQPYGYRWVRAQLVGESMRLSPFKRGVSKYPTIGDDVHLVTDEDLSRIYGDGETREFVRIGSVAGAQSIPALVDLNRLVGRHSAVLGSTGAGKSTTVASILSRISDTKRFPSARCIVFDIHGEYARAMSDRAVVLRASPEKGEQPLYVPYWALKSDELLQMTALGGLGGTEQAVVFEKIRSLKSFLGKSRAKS